MGGCEKSCLIRNNKNKSHMNPKTPQRNETTANLTQDRSRRKNQPYQK